MSGNGTIVETSDNLHNNNTVNQTNPNNYLTKIESFAHSILQKNGSKHSISGFDFDKEEPAAISIVPDGKSSGNMDVNSFTGTNIHFILNSVEERRKEKFQIFETFGNPALFFFNKKVSLYDFSGYFIDGDHIKNTKPASQQEGKSWDKEFKKYWEEHLRGTKLIESGTIAVITFNKSGIWGYPINLSTNANSNAPFMTGFSFSMIVVKHKFNKSLSSFKISDFLSSTQTITFKEDTQSLKTLQEEIKKLEKNISSTKISESKKKGEQAQLQSKKEEAQELYTKIITLLRSASINR